MVTALVLFSACFFCNAQDASGSLFEFDIPATDASSALKVLSRQTGNPTIFQSSDVERVETNALYGRYSLQQALDILLEGTRLSGDITESSVITISRKQSGAEALNGLTSDGEGENGRGFFGALFGFLSGDGDIRSDPAPAEVESALVLEEIVVLGRKREEVLQDVPVSISVFSSDLIAEQNILSLDGLAEIVPGLHYNQGTGVFDDRLAALPSIRGVSSSEIATNRTKVSSFVDGMPIIGSVGAIDIGGATQVEVYRGPQSAAFGRSTFAGAINYVTANPGNEVVGGLGLNWSDQGTRIVSGNISGPVSETLGFQMTGSYEDSVPPDRELYSYSDGIAANTRGGNNASLRFVWQPTDGFNARLTFTNDKTDDGPATSNFLATQESSAACFNSLNTFERTDAMGSPVGFAGEFDCELDVDPSAALIAVHDLARYYAETPAAFNAQVQAAIDAGATDGEFGSYTVEEAIRLIANAYSIPHADAGTQTDRNRAYAQLEYLFSGGSALQLSLMTSEEESSRNFTRYLSPTPYDIVYVPADSERPAAYRYGLAMGTQFTESSINDVEESYAELRWVSSGDERLRYVLGAAYYEYDYLSEVYRGGGFNALSLGIENDLQALTGATVAPNTTFSEFTENVASFFNASYDFTHRITGSIEGRYALDKVGGRLVSAPDTDPEFIRGRSFTPRIALSYSPSKAATYYLQYAEGINPGGINASILDQESRALLDQGVPVALDPENPDRLTNIVSVNYDSADYTSFFEETLTNYEFGFKGALLNDRLTYAGALYHMVWEDAVQSINLDWDYTYADDDLVGEPVPGVPDTFYTAETANTSARVSTNSGTSKTTGIELQAGYGINSRWSINLGASLMRARYSDYCSASLFTGNSGDLGDIAGLQQAVDAAGNDCYLLDGKKLVRQPTATLSLTPRYRKELGRGLVFNASARLQYTGKTYLDVANITSARATYRVNLGFGVSSDRWSATLYAENLLDDQTASNAIAFEAARYEAQYVATGVAPAANENLFFRTEDGGATDYSHLRYRLPVGRTLGLRIQYKF